MAANSTRISKVLRQIGLYWNSPQNPNYEQGEGAQSRHVTSLTELLHAVVEKPIAKPTEAIHTGFASAFIAEAIAILEQVDTGELERMADSLAHVRELGGRLFILGVGGSAGHASHAVNDFRKLCGFEAYAPTDNVSELTARANDEGWETCFAAWLKGSRISNRDAVLVFSVGGGSREKNVSVNIVRALETASDVGARIFGIVGRDGGFTREVADHCLVIPTVATERITPHTEGVCAVLWHLLVSHPLLQQKATRWESIG